MARRKKVKKEDAVGQDTRYWNSGPHHPSCSCFNCTWGYPSKFSSKVDPEPQHTELSIPNNLASEVAKAACDARTDIKYFYLKLIKRGLKTLDFDKE